VNFRILGYVYLVPGAGMNAGGVPESPYWKTNSTGTLIQPPVTAEVVVDVVGRDNTAGAGYTHFLVGGLPKNVIQRTSHLAGALPSGGNILFEDSHVEWRPWKVMWNNGKPQQWFGNDPVFVF
jgi:hypothetical protein